MIIRCVHCGVDLPNLPTKDRLGPLALHNTIADCGHCGGVVALMKPNDNSLPSEFVKRYPVGKTPAATFAEGLLAGILSGIRFAINYVRRRIVIQVVCAIGVLTLSSVYLLDYDLTWLFRDAKVNVEFNRQVMCKEDIIIERSKAALMERLNDSMELRHPWNYQVKIEYYAEGRCAVKSYVDMANEKGEWRRRYYVCFLGEYENKIKVDKLLFLGR